MIKNHKIDAHEFLEFVHDVDLNFLKKNNSLGEELSKIKGKKSSLLMAQELMLTMSPIELV